MKASVLRSRGLLGAALLAAALGGGLATADEDAPQLRLPPAVTYARSDSSPGPVVFSHETHLLFTETRCLPCHPQHFSILRPAGRMTHEEMDAGKKCGACHDGKTASGVQEDCDSCHTGEDGP
jgi:c(7)-type cytochrome triheme protein